MKRSRRVILTMMGSTCIGAVAMGLVKQIECKPGELREVSLGIDAQPVTICRSPVHGPHRIRRRPPSSN